MQIMPSTFLSSSPSIKNQSQVEFICIFKFWVDLMCDLAVWKFSAMLFIIDTTFEWAWWCLLWEGRKSSEACTSCFPLCSPLLIDLKRFMLVMKWSKSIVRLWSVTNSFTNLPFWWLSKTPSPGVLSGWGMEGRQGMVLVFSCWNLWGFSTFCFQDKFYLDLKLILCNTWIKQICIILCLNALCTLKYFVTFKTCFKMPCYNLLECR